MLDQIKAESGDTVIALARLCLRHDKIMDRLNTDMLKSKPGSKTRLDYLRALGKEDREHTELIQSLGYFPKNMGLQTEVHYEFRSVCGIGGGPTVERITAEFPDAPRLNP
jgi:hypothetical protein